MLDKAQLAQIEAKIKPIIEKFKVYLYELSYVKEHGDNILRILLDNELEDIDVNTCADVSEAISGELDKFKFLNDEYLLEVASVGIERPIKGLDEFKKHINKYIEMIVKEPVLTYHELVGTLMAVDGEELSLKINIKGRIKVVKILFSNIVSAQTAVKF
jgi:ribosome maturation factor RimP